MKDKLYISKLAKIRVHGNGFLQAETPFGNKIHVWDKRLPMQRVSTPIHNHDHGFKSTILHGGLFMTEYQTMRTAGGEFIPHQAIPRHGKDTKLETIGGAVTLVAAREFWLETGSKYDYPLDLYKYHLVEPIWSQKEMVITFVQRGNKSPKGTMPTVLVPVNHEPDNRFDRYDHYEIASVVYEDAMSLIGGEVEYEI